MALNGAAPYDQPCAALSSMLSRNALNPADINVLHKHYSSADSPPVSLLRIPQFLGEFCWLLCIVNKLKLLSRYLHFVEMFVKHLLLYYVF